jgi:glyoxylase-like metal-dependent hydrolase (beta-lactamase superfamily II)
MRFALVIRTINTPGHTLDSVTYEVGGVSLFVGDTMFAPDKGTARCDFPGGDATVLYSSIQRILSYPPATKIYLCHDYPGDARPFCFETTVQEQQEHNIHLQPETDFISLRKTRDATLKVPHLLIPSLQLNVDAGRFPPAESNGTSYIKVPINKLH